LPRLRQPQISSASALRCEEKENEKEVEKMRKNKLIK
jgi:hypothetical protein